jgi:hypothetical protein
VAARRSTQALTNMDTFFKVPAGITNVPRWEEDCRQIHARARDLIDGKISVIEAAHALRTLAVWTKAEQDSDFRPFISLCSDLIGLPVGRERQYWAKHALEREDPKIDAVERRWRPAALAAAHKLIEKYRWPLRHDNAAGDQEMSSDLRWSGDDVLEGNDDLGMASRFLVLRVRATD